MDEEEIARLAATGAATPEETWARANARDLVWAVTRPGVMSDDQRRRFLSEAVLAPIEHLLTDERSKNILQKLRTNEPITEVDKSAARASWEASRSAASYASWAASARDASWAAYASDAARSAAAAAASYAAAEAARAVLAVLAVRAEAAKAASSARASAYAAAREAQARWIRTNLKLADLRTN